MRRRISLLVAATTSAVVLAFVIPLCLLVRTMAADRALADADQEARSTAVLVSSLHGRPALADAVASSDTRSRALTTVVLADGTRIGPARRDAVTPAGLAAAAPTTATLRRARAGAAYTQRTATGTRVVVPVVTADGTDVVHTWLPLGESRRGVTQAWVLIALLGALLLGVALLVADRLGRRVSTPLTRVATVADRLREGDLAARAHPEGAPETQALATALNRLGGRIEELLVAERAAVGDLSHRLRTPVTALRIDVERVADPALAERLRQHVGVLQRSVDAIVKDARRPVRHDMDSTCDAVDVVGAAVDFWAPLAEDQGRDLAVDLPSGPLPVGLDTVDLRDVVDILVDNVFAHTPEGTAFGVRLGRRDGSTDVLLEVVDGPRADGSTRPGAETGPETGSETPSETRGSGVGLAIARRTLGLRGGELQVGPTTTGTHVSVLLPAAPG